MNTTAYMCMHTLTTCSYVYKHTLNHAHTHLHICTLTHLYPSSFSIMAIITTWKWSEVLEAPGYLWHLEPCTASSTWWNALTTCGINKCTHDQVGDNLGSLGLWVCVGSELGTGEWVQICSLAYWLHDLGALCHLSEPSPTPGTNRDSQRTYWAAVRTDRNSAQSWAYWPHSVWDVAS